MTYRLFARQALYLALLCIAPGCKSASTRPQFDPTGDTRETITLGNRPFGLALSERGAFVTQLDGATVSRVSLSTLSADGSAFPVGPVPTDAATSPDGSLLLVSNQAEGTASLLKTSGGTTLAKFRTAGSPFRVLFSPDGRRGYATTSSGVLVVIDVALRQTIASRPTGLGAINGIAFSPNGGALYLSATSGGVVTVDPRTNSVVRTYPLVGQLQEVVASPEGDVLYVADEGGEIAVLSLASGAVVRFPVTGAFGLALSATGSKLWATQPLGGTITTIDRATGASLRVVSATTSSFIPRRVAFDRRGAAVVTDEAGFVHLFR